jgi:hypothetical protein
MSWFIGGGILYLVLIFTLGFLTLRKRHVAIFIAGVFLPFMWLVGAILPPPRRYR